jgi:hypothetical protein
LVISFVPAFKKPVTIDVFSALLVMKKTFGSGRA